MKILKLDFPVKNAPYPNPFTTTSLPKLPDSWLRNYEAFGFQYLCLFSFSLSLSLSLSLRYFYILVLCVFYDQDPTVQNARCFYRLFYEVLVLRTLRSRFSVPRSSFLDNVF
ncbi:hypothetical protein RIF29_42354 [Crotalaria pallida]|uniref:Uncharacterized protein n=1 Tax=Crotalaria pallida TaxID=3830 RepID=A0AAN9HSH1_CROPI